MSGMVPLAKEALVTGICGSRRPLPRPQLCIWTRSVDRQAHLLRASGGE